MTETSHSVAIPLPAPRAEIPNRIPRDTANGKIEVGNRTRIFIRDEKKSGPPIDKPGGPPRYTPVSSRIRGTVTLSLARGSLLDEWRDRGVEREVERVGCRNACRLLVDSDDLHLRGVHDGIDLRIADERGVCLGFG